MRTQLNMFMAVISICVLATLNCFGQAARPLDEMTLALQQRNDLFSSYRIIEGTKESQIAHRVFQLLLNTPTVRAGRALDYKVYLLDDQEVNAFSTAMGQVYVSQGITAALGDDEGSWAAVIGHEIGHQMAAHHYKSYLRKYQVEAMKQGLGALLGNNANAANWQVLAGLGGSLLNAKLSRNDEIEADRLALAMMAEAGIHPDFAVTCYRQMARKGEQSKVAAFFAGHPRWATREEKVMSDYNAALATFRSRWSDAAKSPGGLPPAVASLGAVKVSKDDKAKEAVISFPYNVRNAKEAQVIIHFAHKNTPATSASAEFQLKDGSFGIVRAVKTGSAPEMEEFSIRIPAAALNGRERKLTALIQVLSEGEVLAGSQSFTVTIPKP